MGGGHMREHMQQMQQHRIEALHDVLRIRPDQEGAWSAYKSALQAVRPKPPGADGGGPPHDESMPATTPERLDRMAAMMAEHQARFQQMADATKRFYAALNPEQKRAFDALPMLKGPMGGPMGRHGPEGHEHHGEG